MEVEEEATTNHLEGSLASQTTTVINQSSITTSNDIDIPSENGLTNLTSGSNKLDDSEPVVATASVVEETTAEETIVRSRISESVATLGGGIDASSDDVAAVVCGVSENVKDDVATEEFGGGSELMCTVNVDRGEEDATAAIDCKNDTDVGENKSGDNMVENIANDGDDKMLRQEEETTILKGDDSENVEVISFDVKDDSGDVKVENIDNDGDEKETMERVEETVVLKDDDVEHTVGFDVKNDGEDVKVENIDNVGGENLEAMTEECIVEEAVKEEEMVESDKITDEKESLDAEMEAEKSLDVEMETEKTLGVEKQCEKSVDADMETEEEENVGDEEKIQEDEEEEEEEMVSEPESSQKGSNEGKRKRGKITKAVSKVSTTPRKTIEEDVCFICFDGGDLVLCDRRNCPKAYHPSCVNRDEAFFQSKGRWSCGWHLCSICEKKAEYMCYTCTYSLCKACTKTSVILCVREKEKKGLCEACMKTVMLIEKQEDQGNVNFDDKDSWEHLFKDYWIETKAKHNLSLDELAQAKNPCKGSGKHESSNACSDVKDDVGSSPDLPPETVKPRKSKRNAKKQKLAAKEDTVDSDTPDNPEWVSKDLLEFIMHVRNGDSSVITYYEVQDLLLEYIKTNKLRDPNRKSQIICDVRLENLFGKPRVAHIEMLKLLESHFLTKDDSQIEDVQGAVVDTEVSQVDDKDKKRRGRKKSDKRTPQFNLEDYAAIDNHNINLIYLRRKLVEDLLDDMESFHEKIVGTFVRIRISGSNQKQDIYRLVQVIGTSEAAQYTLGKRKTCTMVEILNLDKTETISIDSISNQEFMEDECKRLRQSIKCGLIPRLTVGDILDKATELQPARVNDWLETETLRLSHLRDRASDLGRKKELRECVQKLDVLKTPEERARRLEEYPVIHDDPTMDPEYGSEDDTDIDDKKQELYTRSDSFRFNNRGRGQISPRGDYASNSKESRSGTPRSTPAKNYEFSRNLSNKSFSPKQGDAKTSNFEMHTENSQGRDPFVQQPIILEKVNVASPRERETTVAAAVSTPKVNESEKMWHYKDPSEKIQGPFSMVQLRKWSKNGYFPDGLKIWRKSDKEDDGILLSDALEGKFTAVQPKTVSPRDHRISSMNPAPYSRRDIANPPSAPNKAAVGWTGGQTGQHTGPNSYPSGKDVVQSPTPNIAHLVPCGNNDGNSSATVSVPVAPQKVDPGSQNFVQSSQLGQQVAQPNNSMMPQMVQSTSGQIPQGWTSGPPQNIQPNPSMNMAGPEALQQYNQWSGGVPNMIQNPNNPVGNYMPTPQQPWGQFPFPVNQPNMQQQLPQQNVNWAAMAVNPNMGWVGPNPGNQMSWGPMIQGPQVTGTVDPNWVMQAAGNAQAGWVPQPQVQGVVPTQSWVSTPMQGPIVGVNGNPGWVGNQVAATNAGWVAPPVNQGPVNMNAGWVGGPGNQGAPIANQGWIPPTGNQVQPQQAPPQAPQAPQAPQMSQPPQVSQPPPPPPPGTANQNRGSTNHGGKWGGNENRGDFSGQRRNRGDSGFRGKR
ncbi:uncharacterized protein [Rutidosis leptorrhynchoides]|uniref:uncharacterized protein n=1 Tax=Rutidosis leptorrhynchoides TaxID=125765 RepID=UPI003A9A661D